MLYVPRYLPPGMRCFLDTFFRPSAPMTLSSARPLKRDSVCSGGWNSFNSLVWRSHTPTLIAVGTILFLVARCPVAVEGFWLVTLVTPLRFGCALVHSSSAAWLRVCAIVELLAGKSVYRCKRVDVYGTYKDTVQVMLRSCGCELCFGGHAAFLCLISFIA
jgi:hypothetical protein